jgi:hypothetical protein
VSGRWDLLLEEDSTGEHPRITKGAIWWDGLVPVIVQDGTHSHSLGQAVVRRVGARIEVSLTPAARCLLDVGEGWEIGGTVDDRYTLDNWHPSGSGVAPVFARAQLRLVTVYRRPESANKSTGEATEMDRDATCCRANGRREVETLDGKPISCSEAVEMLGGIDVMLNRLSRGWAGALSSTTSWPAGTGQLSSVTGMGSCSPRNGTTKLRRAGTGCAPGRTCAEQSHRPQLRPEQQEWSCDGAARRRRHDDRRDHRQHREVHMSESARGEAHGERIARPLCRRRPPRGRLTCSTSWPRTWPGSSMN